MNWLDHRWFGWHAWGFDDGHLAVPVRQARAMYRALVAPGVYRELVEESGWSPEDFERWAGDTLQRNLMPQPHPAPR